MQEILSFIIIISLLFIFNLNRISDYLNIKDYPDNKRKLHITPVPLLGGLVLIIPFIVLTLCIFFKPDFVFKILDLSFLEYFNFIFFSFLIFTVGLIDDKFEIKANLKLFLIFLIIFIYSSLDSSIIISSLNFSFLNEKFILGKYSLPFTIFSILLFINAFNMFDGINLQCGLYSLFIFLIINFFQNFHFLSLVFIIQILLFLYLNFKNRTYLGDSGSLFLGFVISIIVIKNYNQQANFLYADQIFILMMIPGFDLLRLAIQRSLKGIHPFSADRNHLHHYFLNKYSFLKTTIIIQLFLILPFLISFYVKTYFIIIFVLIVYTLIILKLKDKN